MGILPVRKNREASVETGQPKQLRMDRQLCLSEFFVLLQRLSHGSARWWPSRKVGVSPFEAQLVQQLQQWHAAPAAEAALLLHLLHRSLRVHGREHAVHILLTHCAHKRCLHMQSGLHSLIKLMDCSNETCLLDSLHCTLKAHGCQHAVHEVVAPGDACMWGMPDSHWTKPCPHCTSNTAVVIGQHVLSHLTKLRGLAASTVEATWGTAGALTGGASDGAAWEGDMVFVADISGTSHAFQEPQADASCSCAVWCCIRRTAASRLSCLTTSASAWKSAMQEVDKANDW